MNYPNCARLFKLGILGCRHFSVSLKGNKSIIRVCSAPRLKFDEHKYDQKRYYKNFGHKQQKEPMSSKLWYMFLMAGFILPQIDYKW